jgi:rubrerythrin
MATLTTKATGGKAPLMTLATVTAPEAAMSPELLDGFLAGVGLNGPFMADLLSSFLAHEQTGLHLYRTVAGLTFDATLRAKYEEFGAETEQHIAVFEELITRIGGDPGYVSPAARLVEATGTKIAEAGVLLPDGSHQDTRELVMLEAVVLAETKCHADWSLIQSLTEFLPEGEIKEAFRWAVGEVEEQEDEHVAWARSTWAAMVLTQATNGQVPMEEPRPAGEGGSLSELTKEELYQRAKEADIPGRSRMGKEELVEAVQEATDGTSPTV